MVGLTAAELGLPSSAECRAEIESLRTLKRELLRIPVSGSHGRTSTSYGGRIQEIEAELGEWQDKLLAALAREKGCGPERQRIEE